VDRWSNRIVMMIDRPSRAAPRDAQFERPPTAVRAGSGLARVLGHRGEPWGTRFTVDGHHMAKLDRFVGQAQRVAARAGREFEGVSIEVDAQGVVSVNAIGLASMLL